MHGRYGALFVLAVLSVLLVPLGSLAASNGYAAPQSLGDAIHHSSSSTSSSTTTSRTTSSTTATSSSTTSTTTSSTTSGGPTFTVHYSVPTGAFPLTGAYDASDRLLFVVDEHFPGLTAVNGSDWAYTFGVCAGTSTYAQAAIYDPANDELYVACYGGSNYVAAVSPVTRTVVATVAVPLPLVLALDPANGDVYVGSDNSGSTISPVSVISGATNQVVATIAGSLDGPNVPNQIVYDPANGDLYVTNNNAPNYLTVINGATNSFVTDIQLAAVGGGGAGAAIYDPSNSEVYVHAPLQAGSDSVEAISTSNVIVAQITPGCGSGGDEPQFAYDSGNGNIYCGRTYTPQSGPSYNQVCEIGSSANAYLGCVTTSTSGSLGLYGQSYLVYDPSNNDVYVAGGGPDNSNTAPPPETIEVVSCSSLALLQTVAIPGVPFQLTFDPANSEVYAGVPQTGSPQFNVVVPISS